MTKSTMKQQRTQPKRALLSVSNKTGIVEFAQALTEIGVEIISTGGTAKQLKQAGIALKEASDVTKFPEMMNGRLKTLHPLIFGGLLGKRDQHADEAQQHQIEWIDLLVCNLYPFAETIQKPNISFDQAIENIDIGGPSMLRAAAKNMDWTTVITDSNDYQKVIDELQSQQGISFSTRRALAIKAFAHTAAYDSLIQNYFDDDLFPHSLNLSYVKQAQLRYGENPYQQAAVYQTSLPSEPGMLTAKQHQGKALSYNNILDGDAALNCVSSFDLPACVVVKHNNPCGVAVSDNIDQAFDKAWAADSQSAFGGIVALNRPCSEKIAQFLAGVFIEVLLAPAYDQQALAILSKKPNLRVLVLDSLPTKQSQQQLKSINGGLLLQTDSQQLNDIDQCQCVTKATVNDQQKADLLFAWQVVKYVKSNAIITAKNQMSLGIGAGQVSRIDAVNIALQKSKQQDNSTDQDGMALASDAFIPFRDSIDQIAKSAVTAIIQPGGSIRDKEVIEACDEHGIAMILTGHRCFKH